MWWLPLVRLKSQRSVKVIQISLQDFLIFFLYSGLKIIFLNSLKFDLTFTNQQLSVAARKQMNRNTQLPENFFVCYKMISCSSFHIIMKYKHHVLSCDYQIFTAWLSRPNKCTTVISLQSVNVSLLCVCLCFEHINYPQNTSVGTWRQSGNQVKFCFIVLSWICDDVNISWVKINHVLKSKHWSDSLSGSNTNISSSNMFIEPLFHKILLKWRTTKIISIHDQ